MVQFADIQLFSSQLRPQFIRQIRRVLLCGSDSLGEATRVLSHRHAVEMQRDVLLGIADELFLKEALEIRHDLKFKELNLFGYDVLGALVARLVSARCEAFWFPGLQQARYLLLARDLSALSWGFQVYVARGLC